MEHLGFLRQLARLACINQYCFGEGTDQRIDQTQDFVKVKVLKRYLNKNDVKSGPGTTPKNASLRKQTLTKPPLNPTNFEFWRFE